MKAINKIVSLVFSLIFGGMGGLLLYVMLPLKEGIWGEINRSPELDNLMRIFGDTHEIMSQFIYYTMVYGLPLILIYLCYQFWPKKLGWKKLEIYRAVWAAPKVRSFFLLLKISKTRFFTCGSSSGQDDSNFIHKKIAYTIIYIINN